MVEVDSKITQMLQLTDKDFKIVINISNNIDRDRMDRHLQDISSIYRL